MRSKEKKWWQHLLIIPIWLGIDLIAFLVAVFINLQLGQGDKGHPTPTVLIFTLLGLGVITIIIFLRAVYLSVKTLISSSSTGDTRLDNSVDTNPDMLPVPQKKKAVWRSFIPLIILVPVATLIVGICGYNEINTFYNNRAHVGFAVPVGTILLGLVFLVVIVIVAAICVWVAAKRAMNK